MTENLHDIADRIKSEHITNQQSTGTSPIEQFEIEEPESVVDGEIENDDELVIAGMDELGVSASGVSSTVTEDDLTEASDFTITDEDLKAEMPDLDDIAFLDASSKIRADIDTYRKNLIIRSGLTVEEANEAAYNRMKKLGNDENDAFLEKNPKVGVVEINKTDVDKLEFTPEEREKLVKVKSIKLKIVEDATLETLPIERVEKNNKAAMLQSLDTNLSQYSVPLPLVNDYCRFKGSQLIQLIQAIRYDDATLDEVISNKASLVYNQLANGANLKKYDEDGKVIMSYQEFINKFLFHDLDMALFGILVASSMEEIESALTCGSCKNKFQWKYNLKTLLNLDDISDDFKARFEDILKNKSNPEYLEALYKKNYKSVRVKSPITQNVYDLNYPTVARAINLYRLIDTTDETMVYLSAFALFIDKAYIYNKKTEKYIEIEESEYRYLLDVLQMIPQEEIDIIQNFLKPFIYTPKFILESKCPSCGFKMKNELSIDDLVFLKARDSSMEIQ